MKKKKQGWAEWSDKRVSIFTGCQNSCRYCFARANALRFKQIADATEWEHPVLREAELTRHWGKCKGVIAFPGQHDITPDNVQVCGDVLENILSPGNRVLLVTKPHLSCVQVLCDRLRAWRDRIEFRFTIGADDDRVLAYWEPHTTGIIERLEAARTAFDRCFQVSFSVEPMLDAANIARLVGKLRPFVQAFAPRTPEIWIGKMNQVRARCQPATGEDFGQVERIEAGQTDERILEIVRALKDDPLVRFKDSIQEVCERNGLALPAR